MAAVTPVAPLDALVSSPEPYPRQVLRDSQTALLLFAGGFRGRNDGYWFAAEGLAADCVDLDQAGLDEMRGAYPGSWRFFHDDAYLFALKSRDWGRRWDVLSIDPPTGQFEECAAMLPVWCSLARDAVILGSSPRMEIVAPDGWQVVNRIHRSHFRRGVEWVVLEPTGQGITPDKVSACLVTRGDQPEQLARIVETLPYDEVIVWDNSRRANYATAGRYQAMMEAKHSVVYFQDDDTLFVEHDKLMAAYEPGRITAVYAHGDDDGGYGDLPLVGCGGLADRSAVLNAYVPFLATNPRETENAYADFWIGVLTPFKHVHLPFEINLEIAQHPSRLVNQPWAAQAKADVTARARQIRDMKAAA